jgi:hypothetical protein
MLALHALIIDPVFSSLNKFKTQVIMVVVKVISGLEYLSFFDCSTLFIFG